MQWKISISSPPQRHTLDTHRPYSNSHLAACVLRSRVPKTRRLFFLNEQRELHRIQDKSSCGWVCERRPSVARPPPPKPTASAAPRLYPLQDLFANRSCNESKACWCFCLCMVFFTCFSGFLPPVIGCGALSSNLSSVISLATDGMRGAWSSGPATKHQHSEPNKGKLSSGSLGTQTCVHTHKYNLF